MIVQKILQSIEIETIQILKTETNRKLDPKTTPTIDRFIIIITIEPVIILET